MSDLDQTQIMGAGASPDATLMAPPNYDATLQMGVDPARTQMGGTVVCPACQETSPTLEPYCAICGFLLSSTPIFGEEGLDSVAPAELVDFSTKQRYKLRLGLNTLGRTGTDVVAPEPTVSRLHAHILIENGRVMIEDLGSSNGTKVGNQRLFPNSPTNVPHNTPLRFGMWNVTLEIPDDTALYANRNRTLLAPIAFDAEPEPEPELAPVYEAPLYEATMLGNAALPNFSEFAPLNSEVDSSGVEAHSEPPPAPSLPAPGSVAQLYAVKGLNGSIDIPDGILTIGRKPENNVVITNDHFVSGRHARIETDNSGTYLTDMGSTNGTVLNGIKITPAEMQMLLDGDEIQLGQTSYVFRVVTPLVENLIAEGDPLV